MIASPLTSPPLTQGTSSAPLGPLCDHSLKFHLHQAYIPGYPPPSLGWVELCVRSLNITPTDTLHQSRCQMRADGRHSEDICCYVTKATNCEEISSTHPALWWPLAERAEGPRLAQSSAFYSANTGTNVLVFLPRTIALLWPGRARASTASEAGMMRQRA